MTPGPFPISSGHEDVQTSTICLIVPYTGWLSSKEFACQSRRCGFSPWVKKIPWRRKWQPTPVFLPGKSHGQRNLVGYKRIATIRSQKSWTQLSNKTTTDTAAAAAAGAKSLVLSDSVLPHRRQPTRLCPPWDSAGKNTGVGGHCLLQCTKVKSESEVVSNSLRLRGLQPMLLLSKFQFFQKIRTNYFL